MRNGSGWGLGVAIGLLLALAAIVCLLAAAWATLPLDGVTLSIDDETMPLSTIGPWTAAFAILGIGVVILIGVIVGVVALLGGLLVALLGMVLGLIVGVFAIALAASPLLLLVWVSWRLLRPAASARPATA